MPSPYRQANLAAGVPQPKKRGRPKGPKRLAKEAEQERRRLENEANGGDPVSVGDGPVKKKLGRPRKRPEDLAINKKKRKQHESASGQPNEHESQPSRVSQTTKTKKPVLPAGSSASDSDVPATDDEAAPARNARTRGELSPRANKRQRPSYVGLYQPLVDDRRPSSSSSSPPVRKPTLAPVLEPMISPDDDDADELDLIDEPVRPFVPQRSADWADRCGISTGASDTRPACVQTPLGATEHCPVADICPA